MKITHCPLSQEEQRTPPDDISNILFGTCFSNHMFCMEWNADQGWHTPQIKAYQDLILSPSSLVLHYGQQAFEGLKAYHTANGGNALFRPQENFKRMNRTAQRLCLPELDVDFVVNALKELLKWDRDWIPTAPGTSLYIRPTIIATEPALGLRVSNQYLFFIIMCPVGPYYPEGFNPVKIRVSEKYVRAAPGGMGEAKTSGNYAASNLAEKEAKEQGFTQVLWLDAIERRYIEEVGSMNLFFVLDGTLVTPQLTGTILPGITRNSVLELAKYWNFPCEERRISIEEVVQGIKEGHVTEIFGCGTAAVISPVGVLHYQGVDYEVGAGKTGPVAQRFFENITGIQYGRTPDPFSWLEPLPDA